MVRSTLETGISRREAIERIGEASLGSMEALLGGLDRDPQSCGDLGRGEIFPGRQSQNLAIGGSQPGEGTHDEI